MKFLNTDAIHESGTLLYNKPVKENYKITTAPCPVFKNSTDDNNGTYIEFNNYTTYEETIDGTNKKFNFNFQKVEFYYESTIETDYTKIPDEDYPEVDDFTSDDGIKVKVFKLIGIIGTNLFGEQTLESNISQLCLYRAFELTNANATEKKDKYNITYYLYSYYSKGNLDYSKRYYLGENIPSGKYEVSYSSLTLNDKAIKGEAVKVDLNDIIYPTNANKKILYPVFGHSTKCAPGKYYELKIYKSDNECPIYLPMQEGIADGKSTNQLVVNVNYSDTSVVIDRVDMYCHTITNLDKWDTQLYCMYNTIHGYTTGITNTNLSTIKYFPVTNNESINTFIKNLNIGDKHDALKTGINNFENIVLIPNSGGYKVSDKDYVDEVTFNNSFDSVTSTNYTDNTTVGGTIIIDNITGTDNKGWCISSVTQLNMNELYKFTTTLKIIDSNNKLGYDSIFDIKFILALDYDNGSPLTKIIEFNNNFTYLTKSTVNNLTTYTINVEKYFTVPGIQKSAVKLACSQLIYKYIDASDTNYPVKTVKLQLNGNANNDVESGKNDDGEVINGFTITDIKLYKLTPKNTSLGGTFYTKYAYNGKTYIGQDTFTLYDNDTHDSEVYREWYYYLDESKFSNKYNVVKISPIDTSGKVTFSKEKPIDPSRWESYKNQWTLSGNISSISESFTPSATYEKDKRVTVFKYSWYITSDDTVKLENSYYSTTDNKKLTVTRDPHNPNHLIGGTIIFGCTASPNEFYGETISRKSDTKTLTIKWEKITSGITITKDTTATNQITDGTILYVGNTYTNTYKIKSIYPIESVSGTNGNVDQINDNWKDKNTYTYKLSFTPTSDNIDTNYTYTVTATDTQKQSASSDPINIIIAERITITKNLDSTVYEYYLDGTTLYDSSGNPITNPSNNITLTCSGSISPKLGSITYQWKYKSTDESSWTNINGATGNTYTIPSNDYYNIGTRYYKCTLECKYSNRYIDSTDTNSVTMIIRNISLSTNTVNFNDSAFTNISDTIAYRNYNEDNIQIAIDKAFEVATADNPSEVWIAKGTYTHGRSLTMKNNVAIYGGFAGTETNKEERVAGNNTYLDGEGSYRVFYNDYTEDNPLTNSAKLDNVTIQNGYIYM